MIRPIDLQNVVINAVQNPPAAQRSEDGQRLGAQAAQAAFAANVAHREESVASASEALGNRVDERDAPADRDAQGRRQRRAPRSVSQPPADEAIEASSEPLHLVDFRA